MEGEQTHRQIERMMDSIPEAFFAVDRNWRFIYINREAERIFHASRNELHGKNMWNEIPHTIAPSFQTQYFKAVHEKRPIEFEQYMPETKQWFEVHVTPFDEGLCVYFHDITSRKESHEKLLQALETNDHLVSAVANTMTGVTISDPRLPDNPVIFANKGFETLTGYSVDEVVGRNCRFLQGPETDAVAVKQIRRAIKQRESITTELLNYRRDGSAFWNDLTISPIFDDEGELIYFVGLQIDVTRRKHAEQELKSELELAKHVQQSVLSLPIQQDNIEIKAAYIPSEQLAGDMYCWYQIDKNRYGIMLLDVVGHGISASLISMSIRSLLQGLITRLVDPVRVMKELNRHMNDLYQSQSQIQSYYFTGLYIVVNTKERTIEYVNAGHPPGLLCSAGNAPLLLNEGGLPIGLVPNVPVEKGVLSYEGPIRIFLYTDGLIERKGESSFQNITRLADFLQEYHDHETGKVIEDAVELFNDGRIEDDICLVAITLR
ncbi:SpoIIE family protein phosphatase [Aneurinibacillus uraniidurans]|uniref:SpoIIE family protein phosphatase n=1 Tax=Aneurinibacillus uraniidurans TaxID=2966586 RepID=UPI00234BD1F4|nr:SpoIIE family protein phosphatase [Aneurinibacillus sp. B1]WCN36955.1 SpoIIE family protein phosphatase [Aneurinibacillus sp. B1]